MKSPLRQLQREIATLVLRLASLYLCNAGKFEQREIWFFVAPQVRSWRKLEWKAQAKWYTELPNFGRGTVEIMPIAANIIELSSIFTCYLFVR